MQLNIKSGQSINLINNLFSLSDENLFYKQHRIRFPGDLLLDKMKKVNFSLKEIINILNDDLFDNGEKEKIIFDYVKYLDDLNDSLLQVLKALTPYDQSQDNNKDVSIWLKKNSQENYTKFKDATYADNDFIRIISNNIKHGNIRVSFLQVTNYNQKKINGFYFSDILDDDELSGPKPEIHKPYKNMETAFSFNHFLLRTAGVVALNFYWLNKILFQGSKGKPKRDYEITFFFKELLKIEYNFFPDEYQKKIAKIIQNKDHLAIKYEKKVLSDKNLLNINNVVLSCKFINGQSNEKIPYWNTNISK